MYICTYIYKYIYIYIYIYIYAYAKSQESYHKYVFVHMLWNACFFMYLLNICPQHLHTHSTPQTPSPPPNPNNSHTLPCPLYTTTTTLFLEGYLLPPPPSHLYFFYLIGMQQITFYPPHICSLCAPCVVACLFECCVIFLNGVCSFFQLLSFHVFSQHMFLIQILHIF